MIILRKTEGARGREIESTHRPGNLQLTSQLDPCGSDSFLSLSLSSANNSIFTPGMKFILNVKQMRTLSLFMILVELNLYLCTC